MSKDHSPAQGGKFNSSIGFVLAAVGSAVGMGNIWLFPYRMVECGGAAFLIPYFIFVALFSYVGLSGEFAIGRMSGAGAMGSFDYALKSRSKKGGKIVGLLPLLGVLGIAIGYSVVVGWVLRYTAGAVTGSILTTDSQVFFNAMAVDFGSIPWHIIAIAVTVLILILGVSTGIEKISKILMPAFFVLFLVIAVRVAFLPGVSEGYKFLLIPDWSKLLEANTWIYAMGQAFFSLSINGAGMLIYGSYMKKDDNIIKQSVMTAVLDSSAALLAAFAIIPATFAFFGAEGAALNGPSLLFVTIPKVFEVMPGGRVLVILFFVSVLFAGITSLMNMLEACGDALGKTVRIPRWAAMVIIGVITFGVGVFKETLPGMGSWMDLITIYVAPFGAVLGAVFIYWVLGLGPVKKELSLGRAKPIGKSFDVLAHCYVVIAAAVVVLGIVKGGIG